MRTPRVPKEFNIYERWQKIYDSLSPAQLALYHAVREDDLAHHATEIQTRGLTKIPDEWKNQFTIAIGGFRSGKTFVDCFKHITKAMVYPEYIAVVIRKRFEQLRNTYVKSLYDVASLLTDGHPEWIIVGDKEETGAIELRIAGPGHEPALIICRIEPDGEDFQIAKTLHGYELAAFTLEEGSQLRQVSWDALRTRLSYPSPALKERYPKFDWSIVETHGSLLSNPAFRGHWLVDYAQKCAKQAASGEKALAHVIRSRTDDNLKHLPPNYFEQLRADCEGDPVKYDMAILGLDGVADAGRPVFAGHFNANNMPGKICHVNPAIKFNQFLPLIRGWDFGYRAASCGFWQVTAEGCAYKIAELIVQEKHVEEFTDEVVSFTKHHFPPLIMGCEDYGDIAGEQNKDTGGSIEAIERYTREWDQPIKIKTRFLGNVDQSLNHMRRLMSTTKNGYPRLSYHPRCESTILGLRHGYHYKVQKDGRVQEKPHKDGYFEHIMDADRYAICSMLPIEQETWAGDKDKAGPGPLKAKQGKRGF